MEEATYSFGGAAKILDIAESKLRYWAQVGFVGPSGRRGGKPVFSFQDLVSVKAAKELVDRGFKAAEIRKAIEGVRAALPHLDRPLDRMRVAFDGTRLVVVDDDTAFEPSGQRVFDFGLGRAGRQGRLHARAGRRRGARRRRPPCRCAEPPRPDKPKPRRRSRPRAAPTTGSSRGRAPRRRAATTRAPRPATARRWRWIRGWRRRARTWAASPTAPATATAARDAFEAALALDPDQPEARFNLANLVLESGDLELAVAEFRRVLQADPGVRRRALQPGRRARTPGRPRPGARPPRTLPGARADDLQLGRPGPRPDRPPGVAAPGPPRSVKGPRASGES